MLINIISGFFIVVGLIFFTIGTIGLLRMPDVFTRMHASTKCDTLGAGLVLLGIGIFNGFSIITIKIFLIIMFIWITNPTAAHIIGKAEYKNNNYEISRKI